MAIFVLPNRNDLTHYDFVQTLEGKTYRFEFRWNLRDEAWYFDLRLNDGTDICNGQKVVLRIPLCLRSKDPNLFPGVLMAIDTSGKDEEAKIDDLGSRVKILYYELSDVASTFGVI